MAHVSNGAAADSGSLSVYGWPSWSPASRWSAAIGALARLGVADALADGPLTVPALAARVGADPVALRRVLQTLSDVGLFESAGAENVALSPLGQLLRADIAGSARRAAVAASEEWRWRAYGYVTHSLRTGEPGFRVAHGSGLWEYLDRDPAAAEWFNDVSRGSPPPSTPRRRCSAMTLQGFGRLVDVGGGYGGLLQAVLQAHPAMRGVVFELPSVARGAAERLSTTTVADRCETIAGDFFASVPPSGAADVLSWVLHDWDDASAIRILTNCRKVLHEGGRVLVIEMIVPAPNDPETPTSPAISRLVKEADLEMLVVVGGRERTLSEYRQLLASADLQLSRVVALNTLPWTLMEATPR